MPLNLGQILKSVNEADLIITPKLNQWLMAHADDGYPDWVVDLIEAELRKKPRVRSGTFSASSSGDCMRRQLLSFLGVPGNDTIDPRLANIFNDGKWRHLRWQANLLTAGLIDRIELPNRWRKMKAYGTLDGGGVVPDDHPRSSIRGNEFGLELKGTNSWVYRKAVKQEQGTKEEHKRQVARYFLMTGFDMFVTIYENKDTQEWFEWVEFPDQKYIDESREELRLLNKHNDNEKLPKMLPQCKIQTGEFHECPFGGAHGPCIKARNWPKIKTKERMK